MKVRVGVASLLLVAACGQPTVTLRYRPAAGQTFQYMIDQEMSFRLEGSPRAAAQQQSMTMHMEFEQKVVGPSANGTEVLMRFTRVGMEVPGMPREMLAAVSRLFQGVEVQAVYDDRMRMLSADMVAKNEYIDFSERLTEGMEDAMLPLPEEPLREGQTWEADIESPTGELPGVNKPISVRYKVRLAKIRQTPADTVARFDVEIVFPTDPIAVNERGASWSLIMAGSLKGDLEYSITRSALVHSGLQGSIQMTSTEPRKEGTIVINMKLEMLLLDDTLEASP